MNFLRSAIRLAHVMWCILSSLGEYVCLRATLRRELSHAERASWLQRCCRKVLSRLGVQVAWQGTAPRGGLLISNHLSYMDILVLSSLTPCCFLSKAEVRSWPFFGLVARVAGTVFLNRKSSSALVQANDELRKRLAEGVPVALFPEGTTSAGSSVLPFHASLFEAALRSETALTPAYITYTLEGGSLSEDVCFWGDMTLLPHLVKLFSKPALSAYVTFGPAERNFHDRKEAAERMWSRVIALAGCGVHARVPQVADEARESAEDARLAFGQDSEADLSI